MKTISENQHDFVPHREILIIKVSGNKGFKEKVFA